MVVTCTLMIIQTHFCFKGGEGGFHLGSLHAVGGLLHGSCLAVAALPCQQVDHPPLVQQLLAAMRLGWPAAAYRILEGLKLGCVLLRLFAHLHLRQSSHCVHACMCAPGDQAACCCSAGKTLPTKQWAASGYAAPSWHCCFLHTPTLCNSATMSQWAP